VGVADRGGRRCVEAVWDQVEARSPADERLTLCSLHLPVRVSVSLCDWRGYDVQAVNHARGGYRYSYGA
jgi:hypothetical protein